MNWNFADFAAAGIILLVAGLACWLIVHKTRSNKYRALLAAALLVVVALVWVELAVGIFNTPLSGS